MKKAKINHIIYLIIIALIANSCIEPFDIKTTTTFEGALVIEATITDEFKYQEINLSKTFQLEDNGPSPESGANVKIIDDAQNTYDFREIRPGKYVSYSEFKALPNKNYQLQIITSDGKSYSTIPTQLTNSTQIDNIYASKEIDDLGFEKISIFVDSFDPTGNSKYYRYEYEETYKIIAPKWSAYDLVITSNVRPYRIDKVFKTREERVCYKTEYSNSIIQNETIGFSEDRVFRFPVRVLSKDNAIISHRYSILVKQYVQSLDAFTFYKTLNKLSGSESLFSQNQPGFFNGNVFSVNDPNEKVIGFFEVSSVSSKRMFFNFLDLFPGEPLPPYFTECEPFAPSNTFYANDPSDLFNMINSGSVKYYMANTTPTPDSDEGPFLVVIPECGDCTKLGTNVKPDFWVE